MEKLKTANYENTMGSVMRKEVVGDLQGLQTHSFYQVIIWWISFFLFINLSPLIVGAFQKKMINKQARTSERVLLKKWMRWNLQSAPRFPGNMVKSLLSQKRLSNKTNNV